MEAGKEGSNSQWVSPCATDLITLNKASSPSPHLTHPVHIDTSSFHKKERQIFWTTAILLSPPNQRSLSSVEWELAKGAFVGLKLLLPPPRKTWKRIVPRSPTLCWHDYDYEGCDGDGDIHKNYEDSTLWNANSFTRSKTLETNFTPRKKPLENKCS